MTYKTVPEKTKLSELEPGDHVIEHQFGSYGKPMRVERKTKQYLITHTVRVNDSVYEQYWRFDGWPRGHTHDRAGMGDRHVYPYTDSIAARIRLRMARERVTKLLDANIFEAEEYEEAAGLLQSYLEKKNVPV